MPDAPEISIIIPTYRRYQDLLDCLQSVARAGREGMAGFEVIVVDDGGALPREIEREVTDLDVRWVYLPENLGQPGAQAAGVRQAQGSILAFLDDDAVVAPNWVRAVHDYFERYPDVGVVVGKIEAKDLAHVPARMRQQIYERRHRAFTSPAFRAQLRAEYHLKVGGDFHLSDHVSGGNFALRRHVLHNVGGIASTVRRGSDRKLSQRLLEAGYPIGYNPEMVIYHTHFRGYRFLIEDNFRVGKAQAQTLLLSGRSRPQVVGKALLDLFLAPFRILEARDMLLADKNSLKVYLVYTGIKLVNALGEACQAVLPLPT
jgi:GT2 family glycosyltransferase